MGGCGAEGGELVADTRPTIPPMYRFRSYVTAFVAAIVSLFYGDGNYGDGPYG